METTGADIIRAEAMVASSWPALNVSLSGRWLLGIADGVSGRANSLFFLDRNDDRDCALRLDWMERTYRRVGLPPRVRLSPLAPEAAVRELQRRGYIFQKPTLTLKRALVDLPPHSKPQIEKDVSPQCTKTWLDAFISCSTHYEEKRDVLLQMLTSVLDETDYILLRNGDEAIATAMGVVHLDCLTVQNVATVERYQRQGFGREVMIASMMAGVARGATWCWIAVEQNNHSAISLYRNLGFEDFYSYIYASLDA